MWTGIVTKYTLWQAPSKDSAKPAHPGNLIRQTDYSDQTVQMHSSDKAFVSTRKYRYFSYFCTKTYVVGTHLKRLTEALLMSTHNMFLCRYKKNIYLIPSLICRYEMYRLIWGFTEHICSCSHIFVCVEVLRPSQPNGVMSSAVSLPNHTFTGQA